MIKNLKYGTFIFWGVCDFVIAFGVWAFLKETRGLSLEEIADTSDATISKLHEDYPSGIDDVADRAQADKKAPGVGIQ